MLNTVKKKSFQKKCLFGSQFRPEVPLNRIFENLATLSTNLLGALCSQETHPIYRKASS